MDQLTREILAVIGLALTVAVVSVQMLSKLIERFFPSNGAHGRLEGLISALRKDNEVAHQEIAKNLNGLGVTLEKTADTLSQTAHVNEDQTKVLTALHSDIQVLKDRVPRADG